jgi:dihydrofolate reductase / thymidylate synthase
LINCCISFFISVLKTGFLKKKEMTLPFFSIIVAIDNNFGISRFGEIPWTSSQDMKFFKDKTVGAGRNAVIMGRKTWESIPEDFRPLKDRQNIVISSTLKQDDYGNLIVIYTSLLDALSSLGSTMKAYDDIFIMGGEMLYKQVVSNYLYLCKRIYVTKFKANYECDKYFPFLKINSFKQFQDSSNTRDYVRFFYSPEKTHQEMQYIDLMKKLMNEGEHRTDRTGTGTLSLFGVRMEFDISKRLPLITTRKLDYNSILEEMLWIISGNTNSKLLEEKGINIWKGNSSKEFIESRGLKLVEGDCGPIYGFQLRHWGAEYKGCYTQDTVGGIDQLNKIITQIKEDPLSRRHVLSYWNVGQIDEMVLPPCHMLCQFYVSADKRNLDCMLYQRSGDICLGVPWNIAFYSTLTYMIANICNLAPRKFIHTIGDAHIYNNHIDNAKRQILRSPRPFPKLKLKNKMMLLDIDQFKLDSFCLENYTPCGDIRYKMCI